MIKAGAAKCAITPPLPVTLAGHRTPRLGIAVMDELSARVLVLEHAGRRVVVVSLDLIWLGSHHVAELRRAIAVALGESSCDALIACTHTHSGPDLLDWYAQATSPPLEWFEELTASVAEAALQAAGMAEPVTVKLSASQVDVAVNRRLARDGVIVREPNFFGPVDRNVRLLAFQGRRGRIAQLLVASLHPVLLSMDSQELSGDWCGVAARQLDDDLGGVTLVLNSAPGDANPILWTDRSYEEMAEVGATIARSASAAEATGRILSEPALDLRSDHVRVPASPHPYLTKFQNRRLARDGGMLTEIQVLTIGDTQLCALPGECLAETATALAPLIPVSYANDYIGYLPRPHVFAEGGYEANATMTNAAGVEQIVAAAQRLSGRVQETAA